ncbi:MAG: Maf family nucleotide pyrophosphatase [Saprospiraceae bacterium]|nr:Maf family nucleotide pyrophosphatase [Saprospiraceae bacterium]
MKSILKGRRLILGSKSPRRSQLLKELDIPFVQKVADIEETFPEGMPVLEVAEYIARAKAEALIQRIKGDDIVITADSVVICQGVIYGKPKNGKQAKEFIKTISDNVHQVVTGVCIRDVEKEISFSEVAEVKLVAITNKELNYYVKEYMPIDKAGAYGIQEWIGHAKIEWIKGTYTNIMGLPTRLVYEKLKGFVG